MRNAGYCANHGLSKWPLDPSTLSAGLEFEEFERYRRRILHLVNKDRKRRKTVDAEYFAWLESEDLETQRLIEELKQQQRASQKEEPAVKAEIKSEIKLEEHD